MIAQRKGKIINIASMLSFQGGIRVPSYTASKSGVAGLTKLLANEWAAKGINVNAIAPGYIATNNTAAMVSRVPDNALGEAAIAHLGRYGVSAGNVARGDGRMGLYFLSVGAGLRPSSIVYDREGSTFALAGRDDFEWDRLLDGSQLLHLS